MILLKNEKSFHEFVYEHINIDADIITIPLEYPCYATIVKRNNYCSSEYLYNHDLKNMLEDTSKIIKDGEPSTSIRCACEVIDSNCGCSFGQCLNGLIC